MFQNDIGLSALEETFYLAVHRNNFKNGAFKAQIKKDTPALHSIDVFLASPLLSAQEKEKVRQVRSTVINIQNGKWKSTMDIGYIMDISSFMTVSEMFEDDMKKQGQYVPPTLIQSLDKKNAVGKTFTIDSEGNLECTEGGKLGCVPGAPAGFNAANMASIESMGLGLKGEGNKKNKNKKKQASGARGKDDKGEKKENSSSDGKDSESTFGNAFEKNLSSAFL